MRLGGAVQDEVSQEELSCSASCLPSPLYYQSSIHARMSGVNFFFNQAQGALSRVCYAARCQEMAAMSVQGKKYALRGPMPRVTHSESMHPGQILPLTFSVCVKMLSSA